MTETPRPQPRRALTLVEATIAMVVLAIVLVAVMQGVGLSARFQRRTADGLRGSMLAKELADRVAGYAYTDPLPDSPSRSIGADTGEADAAAFDDIDDWDGYTESPPAGADGSGMTFLAGWTRSVTVRWVETSSPTAPRADDGGAKCITVVVTRSDGNEVGRAQRLAFETTALGGR